MLTSPCTTWSDVQLFSTYFLSPPLSSLASARSQSVRMTLSDNGCSVPTAQGTALASFSGSRQTGPSQGVGWMQEKRGSWEGRAPSDHAEDRLLRPIPPTGHNYWTVSQVLGMRMGPKGEPVTLCLTSSPYDIQRNTNQKVIYISAAAIAKNATGKRPP